VQVPLAEPARPPGVADEVAALGVEDDAAEVVGHLELPADLECVGVEPVDDGARVRPVFRNGDPDAGAVVVDAAGVVPVALAEHDVLLQVAGMVDDEEVADALSDAPVVAVSRGRVQRGGLEHLHRGQEDVLRCDRHALGVKGREVEPQRVREPPARVAVDAVEGLGQSGRGPVQGWDSTGNGGRGDGGVRAPRQGDAHGRLSLGGSHTVTGHVRNRW